jgi:uncharacterized protein with von Willebrand factor type A (vWA) domain
MSDLEIARVVDFCRELRAHGLSVTPSEVITATTVLQIIDRTDRDEVFLSLRSILTTSVADSRGDRASPDASDGSARKQGV